RVTKHNLVAHAILIPRLNLKYNLTKALTLRLGSGKGYRAPQAFDSDMHIAFAGGGISRIQLHQNLKPEISTSISGGIFYHTISNRMLFDFSIEAFYNKIDKVFILEEILNTNINQQILEKRNGNLAVVNGLTCSS